MPEKSAPHIVEPLCAVLRRRLHAEGQKYTLERARILDAIVRLDDVFDADSLYDELKRAGDRVSKATLYRTLNLLQEIGIVQQILVDTDQAVYQLAYGRTPRDLLIRVDTNEFIPIDIPELTRICKRLCAERGLAFEGRRFQLYASAAGASGPTE